MERTVLEVYRDGLAEEEHVYAEEEMREVD